MAYFEASYSSDRIDSRRIEARTTVILRKRLSKKFIWKILFPLLIIIFMLSDGSEVATPYHFRMTPKATLHRGRASRYLHTRIRYNTKSETTFQLTRIVLSGDIELNPGPAQHSAGGDANNRHERTATGGIQLLAQNVRRHSEQTRWPQILRTRISEVRHHRLDRNLAGQHSGLGRAAVGAPGPRLAPPRPSHPWRRCRLRRQNVPGGGAAGGPGGGRHRGAGGGTENDPGVTIMCRLLPSQRQWGIVPRHKHATGPLALDSQKGRYLP